MQSVHLLYNVVEGSVTKLFSVIHLNGNTPVVQCLLSGKVRLG